MNANKQIGEQIDDSVKALLVRMAIIKLTFKCENTISSAL